MLADGLRVTCRPWDSLHAEGDVVGMRPYGASEKSAASRFQTLSVVDGDIDARLQVYPAELEATDDTTYEPLGTCVVFQLHRYPK